MFDFLVFIGRFQPLHCGHLSVIQHALKQSKHVIVLVGSAHLPRDTRNPFSVAEREEMIRVNFNKQDNARIHVLPLTDVLYNEDVWVRNVQKLVEGIVTAFYERVHQKARVGLIGHNKDHTSYYLNRFPQWQSVEVSNYKNVSATTLREAFFSVDSLEQNYLTQLFEKWKQLQLVSDEVIKLLSQFSLAPAHSQIVAEQAFIDDYKQAWNNSPYPPIFVTVDAVVVQSGHVLLIERRARPGKGLLALPGGFINQDEPIIDACLRELREETRLKVPQPVLKGSCVKTKVYDAPHRSARGRTITHAFLFTLSPEHELPKVKGGDDALKAFWYPLSQLSVNQLFEDHYFIIEDMLGANQ